MAKATLPAEETTDAPAGGGPTPPDPHAVYRQVTALLRWMHPGVRNIRIVGDVPDADGGGQTVRVPVPADRPPDDLKGAILFHLGKLKPGEYLPGKVLAMLIDEDLDHKSGAFTRSIRDLRDCDPPKIESHQTHGYRLAAKG